MEGFVFLSLRGYLSELFRFPRVEIRHHVSLFSSSNVGKVERSLADRADEIILSEDKLSRILLIPSPPRAWLAVSRLATYSARRDILLVLLYAPLEILRLQLQPCVLVRYLVVDVHSLLLDVALAPCRSCS